MKDRLEYVCKKRGKSIESIAGELGYSAKELIVKLNEASNMYMKICIKLSLEPNDLCSGEDMELFKAMKNREDLMSGSFD